MRYRCTLIAVGLLLSAPVWADWPMYAHDPARTGVADGGGPSQLEVQWSVELGGRVDSSPAVSDGVVYVGSTGGSVYAVDAETGEIVWRQELDGPVTSSPCVAEGRVFVGCVDTFAYALDARTGDVAWRRRADGPVTASPAFLDGVTYWASTAGRVFALRAADGDEVWRHDLGARVAASPCVGSGALYIGDLGGALRALRLVDGAPVWQYDAWGPPGGPKDRLLATAALVGSVVFVGSQDMWHGEPKPPAPDPDLHLQAVDAATGEARWTLKAPGSVMGSPAVGGGIVYAAGNEGYPSSRAAVYAVDAASGAKRWRWPEKGSGAGVVHTAPAIAGDMVYFADLDGTVYIFSAQKGAPVALHATGGPVYSSPAISDGRLFVGSGDGKLYCF
ncbi:MAG: PQQ-binding-like beta-propeller repeat protein [Armatimonadota bacterium]